MTTAALATVKTAHLRAVADWLESHPATEDDPDRAERIALYRAEADRRDTETLTQETT